MNDTELYRLQQLTQQIAAAALYYAARSTETTIRTEANEALALAAGVED